MPDGPDEKGQCEHKCRRHPDSLREQRGLDLQDLPEAPCMHSYGTRHARSCTGCCRRVDLRQDRVEERRGRRINCLGREMSLGGSGERSPYDLLKATGVAVRQMRLNTRSVRDIQRAVHVLREEIRTPGMLGTLRENIVVHRSDSSLAESSTPSACRAWFTRLLTVPTGTSRMAPISAYDRSWTNASRSTS